MNAYARGRRTEQSKNRLLTERTSTVMFMSSLSAVPRDLLEVAMLDGCTSVQRFFKIKMRYLASSVSFVTIMSLINSFKVFREVYLLTGNYPYDSMYTLQHFMNNKFAKLDYQDVTTAAYLFALGEGDSQNTAIAALDFTNPAFCAYLKERLKRLARMGVGVIKTDFSEEIPEDAGYFSLLIVKD